jgi:hypothetical protein
MFFVRARRYITRAFKIAGRATRLFFTGTTSGYPQSADASQESGLRLVFFGAIGGLATQGVLVTLLEFCRLELRQFDIGRATDCYSEPENIRDPLRAPSLAIAGWSGHQRAAPLLVSTVRYWSKEISRRLQPAKSMAYHDYLCSAARVTSSPPRRNPYKPCDKKKNGNNGYHHQESSFPRCTVLEVAVSMALVFIFGRGHRDFL